MLLPISLSASTLTTCTCRISPWTLRRGSCISAAISRSVAARSEPPLQPLLGLLQVAVLALDGAGHPVLGPQLVQDRATNPLHGEALQARAALRVEALYGVDEAEDAALGEIRVIHVRGQPHHHPVRHDADERRVPDDEPVTGVAGGRREILRPLLVERLGGRGSDHGDVGRGGGSHRVETTGPRHALSCTDPECEGSARGCACS